jgi:hypothetical protein
MGHEMKQKRRAAQLGVFAFRTPNTKCPPGVSTQLDGFASGNLDLPLTISARGR